MKFTLTIRRPCIVMYSDNESQEMHYFSNLFDKDQSRGLVVRASDY